MEVHHSVFSSAEVLPWLLLLSTSSSAKALPASASPCSAALSPSLSRKHGRRKHVLMAFSDSQEFGLLPSSSSSSSSTTTTSTSNMQHTRGMRSAKFFADRLARFGFLSAEQMQPPRSFVRAKASLGRFSGAVHGGNSRKGRVHKRSENSQELESFHQEKEILDEPSLEHADSRTFCDDVPNAQDSDHHISCDTAPGIDEYSSSKCTASLLSSTNVYDSIRGDFWMNDPYYQEFEALDIKEDSHRLKGGSLRDNKALVEIQGGNGAALDNECLNLLDSRSDFPAAAAVHISMSGETCNSFQEPVGVAERNRGLNETCYDEINRGEDVVRTVESAERPLVSFGSLPSVEINNSKNRLCSGKGKIVETDLERGTNAKGALMAVDGTIEDLNTDMTTMAEDSVGQANEVTDFAEAVAEQVGQMVEQVTDLFPDSFKEQMVSVVDQVEKLPEQVSEQVSHTAEQLVEQVTTHVVDPISTTASQIANFFSSDEDDEESDDEFEAYASLDIPEFKGREGLNNFTIVQEQQGFFSIIYDFYIFMLKRSMFEFLLGMFAAPILLSMVFTILYLPQFNGLAFDENVRDFLQNSDQNAEEMLSGLQLSWQTVFQVFMFSVSLSTGLQPELSPLSPYTLVVANLNALFAQLIFVFLSGAVFARLSQPTQPVKCSTIAIICPPPSNRRLRKEACYKYLLTRYVLAGPQPCELVDVKVDLTYYYNTVTRSGTYFRTSQSLKLMHRGVAQVRPEIAFLDHGMVVRHIIDETSPLFQRTRGMLEKEDAVFSLSVVGLERSSMQSVFHVEHYCVYDNDVVWDAEFVDMILINKKNRRVVDHSLLSQWRTLIPR